MGNRPRVVATQADIEATHARIKRLREHCEECKSVGNPQHRHFKLLFFMQKLLGWFDKEMDF